MGIEKRLEQAEFGFAELIDKRYRIERIGKVIREQVSYVTTVVLPGSIIGVGLGLSIALASDYFMNR